MIAYLLISAIVITTLWAIADGMEHNAKHKDIASILRNAWVIGLVGFTAYTTYDLLTHHMYIPIWKIVVGFICIRFLIFDYVYNITRNLPLGYRGTTKIYDKILQKVPTNFITFVKIILGIMGTCFLLGLGQ